MCVSVEFMCDPISVCLQDLKEQLTSANSTKKDVIENSKKLKQSLNDSVVCQRA